MSTFDKVAGNGTPGMQAAQVGPAIVTGVNIFLDRFIFYGSRSILFIYLYEQVDQGLVYSVGSSYSMIVFVTLVLALFMDAMLELRASMAFGAILNGLGLIALCAGQTSVVLLGLSFMVVGSGLAKLGNITYFGYLLSRRSNQIEGGYYLAWLGVNLGAFFSGLAATSLAGDVGYEPVIVAFGVLSLAQGAALLLARQGKLLPAVAALDGTSGKSAALQAVGWTCVLGLCLGVWVWMLMGYLAPQGEAFVHLLKFAALIVLIIGYILYATAGGIDVGRRNGIVILMLFMAIFLWAAMGVGWSLAYQTDMGEGMETANQVGTLIVAFLSLGLGLALVLKRTGTGTGYKGAGLRLLAGVVICAAATNLMAFLPSFGIVIVFGSAILFAVGEALWNSLAMATLWRLAPGNRKALALGLMTGAASMGGWLEDLFHITGATSGGVTENALPTLGVMVLSALAIFGVLGVWNLLNNYAEGLNPRSQNPFE